MHFLYTFFIFIAFAFADTTTSSSSSSVSSTSVETTLVWVTGTDASGILRTTQSPYYQSFMSTYTTTSGTVPAGSIGLGSISGTLASIRTYESSTISLGSGDSKFSNIYIKNHETSLLLPLGFLLMCGSVFIL